MNLYTNIKRDFYTNMKKKSPVRDGNNRGNRGRDKSGQIRESGQRYRGKLSNFLREKHQGLLGLLMKPLSLRRSEGGTCNQHNLQLAPF